MQDMTWRGIKFLFFLVPLVLFSCQGEDESSFEASFEIIPKPHKLFEGNAFFSFGNLLISGPDAFSGESQEFADFCKMNFGLDLAFSVGIEGDTQIEILVDSTLVTDNEGYNLSVKKENIQLTVKSKRGVSHVFSTLKQLLFLNESEGAYRIPVMEVLDAPTFEHRG